MEAGTVTLTAGERIAVSRKLHGWTQSECARRAHVSLSLLSKVESGDRAPSHAFLAAVARALHVTVNELAGQPYRGESAKDDRVHAPIPDIRTVVRRYDLPADLYIEPRRLPELADDVAHVVRLQRSAQYVKLGGMLPGLLEELTASVHTTPQDSTREQAYGLLCATYYAAHRLAHRLGYGDLAGCLEDRIEWAAVRSGDPLRVSVAEWTRGTSYQSAGDYQTGLRVMDRACERLVREVGESSPAAITVLGSLHLREVTMASRAKDQRATEDHLNEARRLADMLPRDQVHHQLMFGPINTSIHEVAALVELGDGQKAVEVAAKLRKFPAHLPKTRTGHHHIDLARAYLAVDDLPRALKAVKTARCTAPQLARQHPMVRETMRVLVRRHQRMNDELRAMVAWLGLH